MQKEWPQLWETSTALPLATPPPSKVGVSLGLAVMVLGDVSSCSKTQGTCDLQGLAQHKIQVQFHFGYDPTAPYVLGCSGEDLGAEASLIPGNDSFIIGSPVLGMLVSGFSAFITVLLQCPPWEKKQNLIPETETYPPLAALVQCILQKMQGLHVKVSSGSVVLKGAQLSALLRVRTKAELTSVCVPG